MPNPMVEPVYPVHDSPVYRRQANGSLLAAMPLASYDASTEAALRHELRARRYWAALVASADTVAPAPVETRPVTPRVIAQADTLSLHRPRIETNPFECLLAHTYGALPTPSKTG